MPNRQAISPVEGILAVLDRGSKTTTYKYGLLLALIDLAPNVDTQVRRLTLDDIAAKFLEIYWNHADPVAWHSGPKVLRQLHAAESKKPEIITLVLAMKQKLGDGSFEAVTAKAPEQEWRNFRRRARKIIEKNPLKLLHELPGGNHPFLFEIDGGTGDIQFVEGAIEDLIRFGSVLRPVIESHFISFVLKCNGETLGGVDLYAHFFGSDRAMPGLAMRSEMWKLQDKKCIYTGERLQQPTSTNIQSIDHVAPWSRIRLSGLQNLLLTSKAVNGSKTNALPSGEMLEKWFSYVTSRDESLKDLAKRFSWPQDFKKVALSLKALYTNGGPTFLVWDGTSLRPRSQTDLDVVKNLFANL